MYRVIVYIDGFNLYYGLREKNWRRYYWLDVHKLANNLLKPNQRLIAVRYFTARIKASFENAQQKKRRQNTYLDALGTLPATTLHFGKYLKKTQRCNSCNSTWFTYEEKMTDVNIAVKLLVDAQDDRFDTAIIVSADSDLSPPIDTVLKRNPMKRIVVAFPPKRFSNALKDIASASTWIDRRKLKNSQFPRCVKTAEGLSLCRPQQWT